MHTIAVVILNYNGRHYLEQFLPSVLAHSGDVPVYVADNASTDDSLSFLAKAFPQVSVLKLSQNTGYAGGYNEALAQVKAKYWILLNSDIETTPNWTQPLLEAMEANPRMAACQPKVRSYAQPSHFEYAGAAGGFIDTLGYPFCRGRIFTNLEPDNQQFEDDKQVFWATGACMCVRAEAFEEVGGFDADFFAHMEEIDLCWRFSRWGWQCWYVGQSTVFHVGGGTLPKSNPFKTYLNFRNALAMLYKNHPRERFWPKFFLRLVLDGVAGVKFLLTGYAPDCMAIIRAHFNFYGNYPSWRRKRLHIQAHKPPVEADTTIYPQSIVYQFIINKKATFNELDFNKKC